MSISKHTVNQEKNTIYERYRFRCRNQIEDEAVDKWVKELKTIASNCEFADEENMIRDQLVFGYRDQKVKERMLRESTLTLSKALEICRAAESTKSQMKSMSSDVNQRDVNAVQGNDNERFSNNRHISCYNCTEIGHYSSDCPRGDNFPRGRRRSRRGGHRGSRGGGRGAGRGISRGGHRSPHHQGQGRNNQHLYEVEEEDGEYTHLSTLSLNTLSLAVQPYTSTYTHIPIEEEEHPELNSSVNNSVHVPVENRSHNEIEIESNHAWSVTANEASSMAVTANKDELWIYLHFQCNALQMRKTNSLI